jgi:hypothetical protein
MPNDYLVFIHQEGVRPEIVYHAICTIVLAHVDRRVLDVEDAAQDLEAVCRPVPFYQAAAPVVVV